jgi:hypothetical protein
MRRLGTCLVVTAFVLGLAACGDDGGGSDVGLEEITTTTSDADATTTTAGGSGGSDGAASDAYCEAAQQVFEDNQSETDFGDPGAAEEFAGFLDDMRALADEAPDDVAADVETVADVSQQIFQAALAAGDDSDAQDAAALQVLTDNPGFETALEHVDDFTDQACEIDLNGDGL